MGLDTVEMVMAVEETFEIELSNEVAASCITPRLLIQAVAAQLQIADGPTPCLALLIFHRLRRAVIQTGGVARQDVRLDRLIGETLPPEAQRRQWQAVRELSCLREMPFWGLLGGARLARLRWGDVILKVAPYNATTLLGTRRP